MITCAAFDCFGTVFDTAALSRDLISDYVRHVRSATFSPYTFPPAWYDLPAHQDSADGIRLLQAAGIACVALSNGTPELIRCARYAGRSAASAGKYQTLAGYWRCGRRGGESVDFGADRRGD